MNPAFDLETTALYALGIPLFAAVIACERAVGRSRGVEYFGFAETLSNLSAGLGTLLVGLLTGPAIYAAYGLVVEHVALLHWPEGSWLRWPFALLLSDLCYYAHHRAGHRFGLLWAIHGVHHQHEHFNSTVGLRLEWLADVSTVFFFSPLPLLGIEADCFFPTIGLLSLYALTAHMPAASRPSLGLFVTPAVHGAHHSRDVRYIDCNYSSMFTLWDRLFGTLREPPPGEVLRADLPSVVRCHDGVSTQFSLLSELGCACRAAPTWRAAARLLYEPPNLGQPSPAPPRDDGEIGAQSRLGLLLQLSGTLALALIVLWGRSLLPISAIATGALAAIWGLRTLGGGLDGRPGSAREEKVRLLLLLAAGLAFSASAPLAAAGLLLAAVTCSLGLLVWPPPVQGAIS